MAHILLIDDDADLVSANCIYLESRGYKVTTAFSGDEGWKALEREVPDLLVLDCMMEEFNTGFQLAQDINFRYPTLPLILLTAVCAEMNKDWKFSPEDQSWLPVHRLLEKPVSPAELEKEIVELLKA